MSIIVYSYIGNVSFIFDDKDIIWKICHKTTKTPSKVEIILDLFHNGKWNLPRNIDETIRQIKENCTWYDLTKHVEKFIKHGQICHNAKTYRNNLDSPLVNTETPKTAFKRINIDILEISDRNYALTIRNELTQYSKALYVKSANTLLL